MPVKAKIGEAIKRQKANIASMNQELDKLMRIDEETNELDQRLELKCALANKIVHVVEDVEGLSQRRVEKAFTKFFNQ
jgi:hypothetical protein